MNTFKLTNESIRKDITWLCGRSIYPMEEVKQLGVTTISFRLNRIENTICEFWLVIEDKININRTKIQYTGDFPSIEMTTI